MAALCIFQEIWKGNQKHEGHNFHRIYFSNFQDTLIRETFVRYKNQNFLDKFSRIE